MRLVIADDHGIVREGLRWMLAESEGLEIVGEAGSGEELLSLLADVGADVVLVDVRMPGIGGLEALMRMRVRFPEVRAIVLSMHDQPAYVRRAVAAGAAGYVLKNAGRDVLLTALRTVAEGGTYFQGEAVAPLAMAREPTAQARLSPREAEVLQLVADGFENKQIARELALSEATIKGYLKNIFDRLAVSGRAEAVATALRLGLIE